jgi:hypothetical protein
MKNKSFTALCALGLLVALTGCSHQAMPQESNQKVSAAVSPTGSSLGILNMYKVTSGDVQIVDDPDKLTSITDLILEGKIVGFSRGRHWLFGGEGTEPVVSTIMEVKVSKIFKGGDQVSSGTVYVEHFLSFDMSVNLDELNASLAGYNCGLFLIEAAGAGYDTLLDPEAGRPAGQKLWIAGGQTFAVQDKTNNQVVWPALGEVMTGKLEDAMPGGSLAPDSE